MKQVSRLSFVKSLKEIKSKIIRITFYRENSEYATCEAEDFIINTIIEIHKKALIYASGRISMRLVDILIANGNCLYEIVELKEAE